ncbi:MAG: EAL domain-containing protein [Gammaproteobacteria bacterium]|nr:EAL domain-containing protein [Gammaproteobacteria bacterium]
MTQQAPKQVLIVDDSDDYSNLLLRFMNKAFPEAKVTTYNPVGKGAPGPDFDWSKFDVVIMEYRLGPEENGLEWLRRFKRDHSRFPATILLTDSGSEDVAVRSLRYGAHDYLRKQNLSAQRLADSISDAFNVRARQSSATQSLTLNASRFSKSFFYGQFKLAFDEAEKGENRAVVLITIDGFDALRDSLGVLGTDAIARHLGKISTEIFKLGRYRPRATRFTDSSIALLVGEYKSREDLERLLKALCARVGNAPPEVDGTPVRVTVSIGAVIITDRAPGVAGLLQQAEKAAEETSSNEGDSVLVQTSEVPGQKGLDTAERAQVFDAKEAIRENRIEATFQALMKVSERSSKLPFAELFQISPRFIAHNGQTIMADAVLKERKDDNLARLVDRWKLRECVSRLLGGKFKDKQAPGFYLELSEASCTDVKLAPWIGELIKKRGGKRRFGDICLSVSGQVFMRHLKPLLALFGHLQKQFGFIFGIHDADDPELCKVCFGQFPFSLLSVTYGTLKKLTDAKSGDAPWDVMRNAANKRAALSVASGIEDADALTLAISKHIDFVQGDFIAPEQEEIEAVVGVESVQIRA